MNIDKHILIYLSLVGLGGPVLLYILKKLLNTFESQRVKQVKDQDDFQPISTSTPFRNPLKKARQIAINGITGRFSIIRKFVFVFFFALWVLMLALPFIGRVPATVISILVTASAILIGMASKPFVENLVSGFVITFSRPFHIGDTLLIEDNYGTVEDITLTHTIIKLWDWRRHLVPNSIMISKEFLNYSMQNTAIWAYVEFWVDYSEDMDIIREIAVNAATQSKYCMSNEAPSFWIMETGIAGIKCWVAAWAESPSDAWMLKSDTRTNMLSEFRTRNIKTHSYRYFLQPETEKKE
mgnify:CR=1 FL=1